MGFCLILLIGLLFPPFGGQYRIPSMAMAPTLVTGDVIYASNYGYTFSNDKHPVRGDMIIFRTTADGPIFVKRVVGLPGDAVQMRSGDLFLNEERVERTFKSEESLKNSFRQRVETVKLYDEALPSSETSFSIFDTNDTSKLDNTQTFNIPEGHIFVLGDNRDNSWDSRAPKQAGGAGMVPIQNIIGEVKFILRATKSCKNDEGHFCPERKRFQKL